MNTIYLDNNATTPVDPEVAKAMQPYISEYFGNPSSNHLFGTQSKKAVENARKQVASLIKCKPGEIIFTSGGTESNNYAIKGIALKNRNKGNHIITSSIEHPAVYEVCRYLERTGFEVSYLPVDKFGRVDPESVRNAIKSNTILITVMHANNEVGTIQPIEKIASIAREANIVIHTDAAQSAGKIKTDVKQLGIDLLSIAGHKMYAPKGIGALYVRNGIRLEKLMHGADHEQNMRAGTENVIEIVGLGKACEIAESNLEQFQTQYAKTSNYLFELLRQSLPGIILNGHPDEKLPNTLSISFPGVEANTLVSRLKKVAASAGAACHSESIDVSGVLKAMQVPMKYAMGTIRFSTGRNTSMNDIKLAAEEIISATHSLMPGKDVKENSKDPKTTEVKLTSYTHGLGCACKIKPQNLEKVLASISSFNDPAILVGPETSDDASVYKLNNQQAIVQTLDFFTPVVDDPYHFGAIAACNALSDIYAMGAKPLYALNIAGFPENTLPLSILEKILKGASDKTNEAGIGILGGHTIEDPEPKYGLVVTGIVHPEKIIRNKGAVPGDKLILTKAIGTGILSTAMKRDLLNKREEEALINMMSMLNKLAAEKMLKYRVHACTDITGFGLTGHLREMSVASKCDVTINSSKVPVLEGAMEHAAAGLIPGGSYNNHSYVSEYTDYGTLGKTMQLVLSDAQTSGGLLVAMPAEDSEKYLKDIINEGLDNASVIGEFTGSGEGKIRII